MISLKPLIDRLEPKPEGFAHQWFRQVGGAGDFARIRIEALPLPAAWIVRAADTSSHAGERAEDVAIGFDVVIAIENIRATRSAEVDDVLLAYRKAIKDRLLGWEIEPDVKPLKFNGGKVLSLDEKDIYWADRYTCQALITNYLPDPPAFGGLNKLGD